MKKHWLSRLFFASLLLLTTSAFGQNSLEQIMRSTRNYAQVVAEGERYFQNKYPGLTPKDLSSGPHRDGEYVKFMRWQSFWKGRLNPDGTLGDPTAYGRKATSADEKLLNPYANVPWTEINYTDYIGVQIGLGRTTCVAFHPTDVFTFYVGAAIGGIWRTTDGGRTYVPLGDELPFLAVSAIIVDQQNPNTLYIAVSDHVWYGPSGIGVYKSTNGGTTWAPTSLAFSFSSDVRIYWMEADPTNPQRMFVATANGVYRTTNGFTTVAQVLPDNCFDVRLQPGNPNQVYVGTNNGRLLRSTDGGNSFTQLQNFGGGSVFLATHPLAPDRLWARHGQTLHLSSDGGVTFPTTQTFAESNEVFTLAPLDEDIILSGNFDTYRSNDGGATFSAISHWLGNNGLPLIHVDQRNMFVNPLEPDAVYYCNDGGLYRYLISANHFVNLSDGLAITQYYDIAVAQTDANIVGGGSQDNGNVFRQSNGDWLQYAGTGDGMNQEIDPTDAGIRYWSYQFGSMNRWQNGSNSGIKPAAVNYDGAWETPYKIDPASPNRLIAGFRRVYESLNRGSSWTAISGELAGGGNLEELSISPANPERIYAVAGGSLYVKNTFNDTWITRNLPAGNISDLEADPTDIDKVYISTAGYTTGEKVFVSTDAGATWTNISGSLPNVSTGALELYHDVPGAIFVGTDVGVFYRDPSLTDWLAYGNLPNTRVEDIEIQYAAQLIRVGTHGRGVLEAAINIQSCTPASPDGDGDGVCDVLDFCPNFQNSLIGTPCDDGDAFSSGETYDNNCGCSGGVANLSYCFAEGAAGTGADYLDYVGLNTIDNASGQTNYSDFRSISTDLTIGNQYTITAGLGFSFGIDRLHAWIDYDRSGTFDASEAIAFTVPNANHQGTGTFTVPPGTAEGVTTLRVRAVYSETFNSPCGSAFGEVEDYTVRIVCGTGAGQCLLPLDWVTFSARPLGKDAASLRWSTAAEAGVSHFEVFRSTDGDAFSPIGTLPAQNRPLADYTLLDTTVRAPLAYYRITAVDYDGSRSNSPIRRVDWPGRNERAARLFPNPHQNGPLQLTWQQPNPATVSWHVYNAWGQLVREGSLGAAAGANQVELAVDDLPAGTYLLRLRAADWDWTEAFLRQP